MRIIGVAGGSGSGKTTFVQKVNRLLPSDQRAPILHLDCFYLPQLPSHLKKEGVINFDHPDAFDWPLLKKCLVDLKNDKTTHVPQYDFAGCQRKPETTVISPASALLFEGILALWDAEVREMLDLKVFLHVEADIRLIRRIHRDIQERGRTVDSIVRQYYDTVRPMHREYVEPTRQYADIVVGEETDRAANLIASYVTGAEVE